MENFKTNLSPRHAKLLRRMAEEEGLSNAEAIRYAVLHAICRWNNGDNPFGPEKNEPAR